MFIFWIVTSSILVTILAVNFTSGETEIDKRIPELYSVSDPQFLRSMGNLLGPSVVPGNQDRKSVV